MLPSPPPPALLPGRGLPGGASLYTRGGSRGEVDVPDNGPNIESLEEAAACSPSTSSAASASAPRHRLLENVNKLNGGCVAAAALDQRGKTRFDDAKVFIVKHFDRVTGRHRRLHLSTSTTPTTSPPPPHLPLRRAAGRVHDARPSTRTATPSPDLTSCAASSEVALMQTLFPQSEADDADAALGHRPLVRVGLAQVHALALALLADLARPTPPSSERSSRTALAPAPSTRRTCSCAAADVRDGAAVKMVRAMCPSRIDLADISARYRHRLPKFMQTMDDRAFVSAICAAFDIDADDATSNSRLFFKAGKVIFLNQLCRQAAAGAEGAAEVIVLNWKLGQWQRGAAPQMVRVGAAPARGRATPARRRWGKCAYRRVRRVRDRAGGEAGGDADAEARADARRGQGVPAAEAAVLLMQTRSRSRAARVYVPQHRQQLKGESGDGDQRRHRGGVVKARYGAERKKVTLVAATWRGYAARTRYQSWQENGRVGILKAQSAARAETAARAAARAAAQQIESTWKMVRVARLASSWRRRRPSSSTAPSWRSTARVAPTSATKGRCGCPTIFRSSTGRASPTPPPRRRRRRVGRRRGGAAAAPVKSMFGGSKDGEVKSLSMAMVSAVSAGLKTGMMKKWRSGRRVHGDLAHRQESEALEPTRLRLLRPLAGAHARLRRRQPEERDRWLKNLRLVLVHARTYDGFGGGGAAMALMKQAQNAQPAGPLSPGMRRRAREAFAFGKNAGEQKSTGCGR